MASSSSCALEIRGALAAREFLPAAERRGRRLTGSGSVRWRQRRVRCGGASVAISPPPPAASTTSKSLVSSFPYSEFALPKHRSAVESAAEACAKATVMAEEERAPVVTPEKLDSWVRGSVVEIVRNIRNAPFLVQIFESGRGGGSGGVRLETEAASPESWPRIKKRWGGRASGTPDVVILVEELKEEEEAAERGEEEGMTSAAGVAARREGPHTWGLAVQGRSMDCTAFYILDTTSVKSTMGFCTHFTLARAKCFGEPVDVQLRNAWLQRM